MMIVMRTTINLPEEINAVIRSFAASKGISLGEAVSELVQRGLRPPQAPTRGGEFPQFPVPEGAAPITLEQTLAVEDDL
jgi:hypothetical protein